MPMGAARDGGRDNGEGWPAPERPVFGALDVGTNNCRLLIARPQGPGFRVIDAFSRIVRLGEGVGRTGQLSEAAVERTVEALRICADKMRRRSVTRFRAVATEACRRAMNGADFLDRVAAETGIRLEVITTAEEARLAVAGCLPLIDPAHAHALVFDIGGGSTELMFLGLGRGAEPILIAWVSLPCGVVTLAEQWGGVEIDEATYEGMVGEVRRLLAPFDAAHGISAQILAAPTQMLGTSGTVTTLAGVHLGLRRYDRLRVDGLWISFADVQASIRALRDLDFEARARHPCVGRERADLVIAGCAILEAIGRTWPTERLRIADRGVREGILNGLIADSRPGRHPDGRRAAP
ncbi:MAG: Ppx/GppA family phosphatase [Alphaproteobacteria bacterium]|nr:Ppx/GppA family phosphatase [Alphaproteobacteria bacterium]